MAIQCTAKNGTDVIGTVTVRTDTQAYRNRLCPECRLGLPTDLYGGSLMLAPNYDEHAHLPTDGINSIGRQHCRDGDGGGGGRGERD